MGKKVLHVSCGALGKGGISTVILSIANGLKEQFDFGCVVFKKQGEREECFPGKLHRINAYSNDGKRHIFELLLRPIKLYFGIKRICKSEKYDVIHCHNLNDEGICLLAAKHSGVAIRVAHSHNTPSTKKMNVFVRIQELLNRVLIKNAATCCLCCSNAAGESFYHNKNFNVIYNSIDLTKFSPSTKCQHENLTFINVGRYTYQKNQEFIIDVFRNILKEYPTSQLLLVGYGEDFNKLSEYILINNLSESVTLVPGNKVDVNKVYDYSDYMIFPSRYEGFGIVLIEAQAKMIPCFVSEAIQKEADAGLLTFISLEKSAQEWSDEIINYIRKKENVDGLRIKNNLRKYSSESICKQYADIYTGDR